MHGVRAFYKNDGEVVPDEASVVTGEYVQNMCKTYLFISLSKTLRNPPHCSYVVH